MKQHPLALTLLLAASLAYAQDAKSSKRAAAFNSEKDLISLHYDHAPDKDDGHSAAADRTILETMFGIDWITKHAVPVSGGTGECRDARRRLMFVQ